MNILGIDIGGSGIKGAPVDITAGRLLSERHRIPTPRPATPPVVVEAAGELVEHFRWKGPIGCTFPAVVKAGIVRSAANVDKAWIGADGQGLLEERSGCPVLLINDADAAGLAEMSFGAGKGRKGVVIMLTLGTGLGSALFIDGRLVPNTEFGHIEIRGKDAEDRAASRIRKEKELDWKTWAGHVNEFMGRMEVLLSPDLFIVGGGVSKKHDRFLHYIDTRAEVVPARALNEAGIIGAALAARSVAS
ncbi:MAG: ROK family protein [Ectothiorhodospiraceae bacterium AqS1]|nr:ROK family protein [Ectothiorhodospiraceae bacterium AqS1]